MTSFTCPKDKSHRIRIEVNGRGRKAYCSQCKAYHVKYGKEGTWQPFEGKTHEASAERQA